MNWFPATTTITKINDIDTSTKNNVYVTYCKWFMFKKRGGSFGSFAGFPAFVVKIKHNGKLIFWLQGGDARTMKENSGVRVAKFEDWSDYWKENYSIQMPIWEIIKDKNAAILYKKSRIGNVSYLANIKLLLNDKKWITRIKILDNELDDKIV